MNTSSTPQPDLALPGHCVLAGFGHLRLDTTRLRPDEAAARILVM